MGFQTGAVDLVWEMRRSSAANVINETSVIEQKFRRLLVTQCSLRG
jgi:hypothetical protein